MSIVAEKDEGEKELKFVCYQHRSGGKTQGFPLK